MLDSFNGVQSQSHLTMPTIEQKMHHQATPVWLEQTVPVLQIAYCEEKVECRRVMLLAHFGETGFNTAMCKPACDICASNAVQAFEDRDMSSVALDVVRLVRALGQRFSLTHVLDVFRGSNSQAVRRQQHDSLAEHGLGRDLRY